MTSRNSTISGDGPSPRSECKIDGCDRPHYGRGWCANHYARWRRTGNTDDSRAAKSDERERFESKIDKSGDCWLWTDGLNNSGYGSFKMADGSHVGAHVAAVLLSGGVVPPGWEVDHVRQRGCRFRHCVRRDHLEVVTRGENMNRAEDLAAINRRKTHCPAGHAYAEHGKRTTRGSRYCTECHRQRSRRAYRLARGLPVA